MAGEGGPDINQLADAAKQAFTQEGSGSAPATTEPRKGFFRRGLGQVAHGVKETGGKVAGGIGGGLGAAAGGVGGGIGAGLGRAGEAIGGMGHGVEALAGKMGEALENKKAFGKSVADFALHGAATRGLSMGSRELAKGILSYSGLAGAIGGGVTGTVVAGAFVGAISGALVEYARQVNKNLDREAAADPSVAGKKAAFLLKFKEARHARVFKPTDSRKILMRGLFGMLAGTGVGALMEHTEIGDLIRERFSGEIPGVEGIKNLAGGARNIVDNIRGVGVGDVGGGIGSTVGGAAGGVGEAIGNVGGGIGGAVGETAGNAGGMIGEAGGNLAQTLGGAGSAISEAGGNLGQAGSEALGGAGGIPGGAADIVHNLPGVQGASDLAGNIGGSVGGALGGVGEAASQIPGGQGIENAMGAVGQGIGEVGGNLGSTAGNSLGGVGSAVGEAGGNLGQAGGEALGGAGEMANNIPGVQGIENLAGGAKDMAGNLPGVEGAGQFLNTAKQTVGDVAGGARDMAGNIPGVEGVKHWVGLEDAHQTGTEAAQGAGQAANEAVQTPDGFVPRTDYDDLQRQLAEAKQALAAAQGAVPAAGAAAAAALAAQEAAGHVAAASHDVLEQISPTEIHGHVVSGSVFDHSLTYDGHPWVLVENGTKNIGHLFAAAGETGSAVDNQVLAAKLQEATNLWAHGQLNPSSNPDLYKLFNLSNGTESVYKGLLNKDTLDSLKSLGVVVAK